MKEDFDVIWRRLDELRTAGLLVVVEGKNDAKALCSLGFLNIIFIDRDLDSMAQLIAKKAKDCAILTDLDPRGRKIYARLSRDVQSRGVRVNDRLRLAILSSSRLRNIEGIANHLGTKSDNGSL